MRGSSLFSLKPATGHCPDLHEYRPHFTHNITFHLRLGNPSDLFPSGFSTNVLIPVTLKSYGHYFKQNSS